MCARLTLITPAEELEQVFQLAEPPPQLEPRYNIAPTQPLAIVPNRAPRRLGLVRFGLVPSWAPDVKIGTRMLNARAETLRSKPAFREAFEHRRCLVVADGFYEWRHEGRQKLPVYVRMKSHGPFALAGLWATWRSPEGEKVGSCAIVTAPPNALIAPIHDRMPVILPPEAWERWLQPDAADLDALSAMLVPYPAEAMEAYPVSSTVNKADNDVPECIEPLK